MDIDFDALERRDWQTTDDVETTRLAIVGLGWWAENFVLPAVADSDYCETTALVSGSADTAERLAGEHCGGSVRTIDYEAYHDGDGADSYDAVFVATPNVEHLDVVETAADLGKDVVCEKPMEASVERAERLVETCEDAGVTLMTAYRMQFDPTMRRVRELLREGVIGDPVQLHGGFAYHLVGGLPGQWRRDAEVSGGGSLTDIGVYPLNTARFLLDSDPERVAGEALTPDKEFDRARDEHAAFQLTFPDAVTASFTSSFAEHGANWLRILGTEGQITVDPAFDTNDSRTLTVERDGDRLEYESAAFDEVREEVDYFAHCRSTGESPEPDGHDGLTDMRIMNAVYESAETGEYVSL
ncbi:D-xylose 1-dehydrogenase Gfo6 [Halosimplex amylolyticum]|uniref:D-xylose 1-dehydrogenase Gfo6 n=1 Tax=Halosimplex amylolyticum TaxID=3396616 RepID=UPI003F57CFE6